jgi:hypothetical protein
MNDIAIEKKIPCLIFSRVVGYYASVDQFNKGKQSEFADRHEYDPKKIVDDLKTKI